MVTSNYCLSDRKTTQMRPLILSYLHTHFLVSKSSVTVGLATCCEFEFENKWQIRICSCEFHTGVLGQKGGMAPLSFYTLHANLLHLLAAISRPLATLLQPSCTPLHPWRGCVPAPEGTHNYAYPQNRPPPGPFWGGTLAASQYAHTPISRHFHSPFRKSWPAVAHFPRP